MPFPRLGDLPDEEAGGREESSFRTLVELEEERRSLRVGRCKLEDKVLPSKRLQFVLRLVEGRRLVN